jgi:hypothetical protein
MNDGLTYPAGKAISPVTGLHVRPEFPFKVTPRTFSNTTFKCNQNKRQIQFALGEEFWRKIPIMKERFW